MRILIGVCILIVILIPYYMYKITIVRHGARYIQEVDNILYIYNQFELEDSKDSKEVKREIGDVEYLIALTDQLYDELKKNERHFRLDDWHKVFSAHEKIEELNNRIRYQKWLHQIV